MSYNPYTAPRTDVLPQGDMQSYNESIRRDHLSHEASCKGIGALYIISAIGLALASFGWLLIASDTSDMPDGAPELVVASIVVGLFAVIYLVTGLGLRKLKGKARIAAVVLCCIGLLGFPVGTILNGYFLYLLLSTKGKMVFSEEYKEIIAQTPHVKYRTPAWLWVLLAVLLGLLGLGIVMAFVS